MGLVLSPKEEDKKWAIYATYGEEQLNMDFLDMKYALQCVFLFEELIDESKDFPYMAQQVFAEKFIENEWVETN